MASQPALIRIKKQLMRIKKCKKNDLFKNTISALTDKIGIRVDLDLKLG